VHGSTGHDNHLDRRATLVVEQGNGSAIHYGIGVGREGFQWQGLINITGGGMAGLDLAP